jgi:NADP-dependent 3-hydroxy acid dehydrogenase YdfG
MDVVDPAAIEASVKQLVEAYGAIDILVNNAGLMPLSDVDQFKVGEWHRMVDVNVKGLLNTAAVLPQMIKQHSGHIFNMSSIAGRKVFKGLSIYCGTKTGRAFCRSSLRRSVRPQGRTQTFGEISAGIRQSNSAWSCQHVPPQSLRRGYHQACGGKGTPASFVLIQSETR